MSQIMRLKNSKLQWTGSIEYFGRTISLDTESDELDEQDLKISLQDSFDNATSI